MPGAAVRWMAATRGAGSAQQGIEALPRPGRLWMALGQSSAVRAATAGVQTCGHWHLDSAGVRSGGSPTISAVGQPIGVHPSRSPIYQAVEQAVVQSITLIERLTCCFPEYLRDSLRQLRLFSLEAQSMTTEAKPGVAVVCAPLRRCLAFYEPGHCRVPRPTHRSHLGQGKKTRSSSLEATQSLRM